MQIKFQVFLHCDMTPWDLQSFRVDKKACQYLQYQNRYSELDERCLFALKKIYPNTNIFYWIVEHFFFFFLIQVLFRSKWSVVEVLDYSQFIFFFTFTTIPCLEPLKVHCMVNSCSLLKVFRNKQTDPKAKNTLGIIKILFNFFPPQKERSGPLGFNYIYNVVGGSFWMTLPKVMSVVAVTLLVCIKPTLSPVVYLFRISGVGVGAMVEVVMGSFLFFMISNVGNRFTGLKISGDGILWLEYRWRGWKFLVPQLFRLRQLWLHLVSPPPTSRDVSTSGSRAFYNGWFSTQYIRGVPVHAIRTRSVYNKGTFEKEDMLLSLSSSGLWWSVYFENFWEQKLKLWPYCVLFLGLGGVPVWVVALAVCLVLIVMAGAIATSYYLCFWRGGRLGYRPSRELLNKY